jgi:ribokinase
VHVAVVGHVEWVEFASVDHVPGPGDIAHARSLLQVPAGAGGVAAAQLHKLAGASTLFTALGDDSLGQRAGRELASMGVRVEAMFRPEPQRRGLTLIDDDGERTIITLGVKHAPRGHDPLAWSELETCDAVYFVSGDVTSLRRARRARVVVATTRVLDVLVEAGVHLDAVIGSGRDERERYMPGAIRPAPGVVIATAGSEGGTYEVADGRDGSWEAEPLPGPLVDTYGCGDSFAAGVTYALAAGLKIDEALVLGARCGAACATGRGPYEGQLTLERGQATPDSA